MYCRMALSQSTIPFSNDSIIFRSVPALPPRTTLESGEYPLPTPLRPPAQLSAPAWASSRTRTALTFDYLPSRLEAIGANLGVVSTGASSPTSTSKPDREITVLTATEERP